MLANHAQVGILVGVADTKTIGNRMVGARGVGVDTGIFIGVDRPNAVVQDNVLNGTEPGMDVRGSETTITGRVSECNFAGIGLTAGEPYRVFHGAASAVIATNNWYGQRRRRSAGWGDFARGGGADPSPLLPWERGIPFSFRRAPRVRGAWSPCRTGRRLRRRNGRPRRQSDRSGATSPSSTHRS